MPRAPPALAGPSQSICTLQLSIKSQAVAPASSLFTPSPRPRQLQSPYPGLGSQRLRQSNSGTVNTRTLTLLNNHGNPYWIERVIDWGKDETTDTPSSQELLVKGLEIADNWMYFYGGMHGGSQSKGSKRCSKWLQDHKCPTEQTPAACQRKVSLCQLTGV